MRKVLGTSKITVGRKMALISDVAKELNVGEGDIIVFEKDKEGNVIIRKG